MTSSNLDGTAMEEILIQDSAAMPDQLHQDRTIYDTFQPSTKAEEEDHQWNKPWSPLPEAQHQLELQAEKLPSLAVFSATMTAAQSLMWPEEYHNTIKMDALSGTL